MQFFNKLYLLISVLLFSTLSHATNLITVKLWPLKDCLIVSNGMVTLNDVTPGQCWPTSAKFRSFMVTNIAIKVPGDCTIYTYADSACGSIITGVSSAGPLYYGTNYPTGCVNELQGQTSIDAQSLKLVCTQFPV